MSLENLLDPDHHEKSPPVGCPRHDVVKGTGMFNANAAWHTVRLLYERQPVKN